MNQLNFLYTSNNIDEFVDIVNQWYPMLKERETLLNIYNRLSEEPTLPDNVRETGEKLRQYYGFHFGNSMSINEDEEWAKLKTWVDQNLKTKYPQIYYYDYAFELYNAIAENIDQLDALFPGDKTWWEVVELNMRVNKASEEDFAIVYKALTDGTYRETVGHDILEGDARFLPDLEVKIDKYYYKNYLQQAGGLDVVGYFEIEGLSHGASYIVSNNFRITYTQLLEEEKYTWKYVEETDYVEPEDAKYNYIIRRTANTQEEISEALTGGVATTLYITNNVYDQLQFFLDLIKRLETIFLIVGIVMGIFAGLMLLNFISVSITAKRKDIGILRAVGARGSDVFKIFFAEAFIIALICFVFASVGTYIVCDILNKTMVTVVMMKLLQFQVLNVLMILFVSFGISIIATYFPVNSASKKSPVESIRAL